ncbi:MAG: restriction endonuclease [Betaproteobacteria bacterium RIFCSPLOWO2_12_FULL_62_58]|nr:MAG: restriction endonuclease [Betaproteobacteria bacterium RIFCSPLOWO2_12_FULL_62_58]
MTMSFFEQPILNSPYAYPGRYWELDAEGQPTDRIIDSRRRSELITPVPKPKKRKSAKTQTEIVFEDADALSTPEQEYNPTPIINEIRGYVDAWRALPNPDQWQVSPETARLLKHWRHHPFSGARPFFCQIEAVETAIWLAEVAPKLGARSKKFHDHLEGANAQSNPELFRIALKLATGAGKTTVMAMMIAWQTVNAVRHPGGRNFSRGFLVVTPGITIRDRLRVLLPNDPDSYYAHRELIPNDMLGDISRAKIVITNFHAFKLRERMELSSVGRALLKGRGPDLQTLETEGQMLQRVMPELMGLKNIVVLNDEGHHCYRERPLVDEVSELKGDEKDEAKKNNEAARLWISGLEAVKRKLGLQAVFDLSATPFFLRGSGYAEGTLFPWTMSDFSLMDAIECGIVKLPRVPVADNIPGEEVPKFRNLWEHIGKRMPRKGRGKAAGLDPLALPTELQTALQALYGHYEKIFALWQKEGIAVPPVFIVVCNNTATSKLVYDHIAGFERENENGTVTLENGRLRLFRNYDEHANKLARPRTLLIDSEQLESGEALDPGFRGMAADEIERFRREIVERTGDWSAADKLTDQDLLREVSNTVGKVGRLGESIRCVVSVSMLTEGWDANTVTHILGVRAFGTQLLCEQVVGRALRRQSYDLNEDGLFNVEYADVLGIPFDFAAKPVVVPPQPPRQTIPVYAVSPERDKLEIRFPRVEGYRVELPEDRLNAKFGPDSVLHLTPDLVGPSVTKNQGIIGEGVDLTIQHLKETRDNTIVFHLAKHLLYRKYRDPGEEPKLHLFGQLKRIAREWLDGGYLKCSGGTYPAQVLYQEIADMACERIKVAITESMAGERPVKAILDPYNPEGSTRHVRFTTSKQNRWDTKGPPPKCHINWVMLDSDWEAEFCRVAEAHPRVRAYVKNHNLGLEVPYRVGSAQKHYRPDFIVQVDDGYDDPLNLVVEIKGYRGEDAKDKANTMRAFWVPGVNNLGTYGRWAFVELMSIYDIEADFAKLIDSILAPTLA